MAGKKLNPKKNAEKSDMKYLIGSLGIIVLIALFAIFTSSKDNAATSPSTQSSNKMSSAPRSTNDPASSLGLENQLPKLPAFTKDGKPIDPHTLDYLMDLQNAMKDYQNEVEGSGAEIITAGTKLAQAYINAGFYQDTIPVCEQILSVVEAEHGSVSVEAIIPLKLISKAASELRMFREAVEYLTFLESVVAEIYGRTHPDTLGVLMSVVGLYIHTGNVDNALIKLQQYIQLLDSEYDTFKTELDSLISEQSDLNTQYDIAHEMIQLLSSLGEMNYGCSMAWDRVESDPEGIHRVKKMREQQQREIQDEEDDFEDEVGDDEDENEAGDENVETKNKNENNQDLVVPDEYEEPTPYTPYEIYRNQENYRREVIHYREQVVALIKKYKPQRIARLESENSSSKVNPYVVGIVPNDSRAKLAQAVQQYAYLRYQHRTLDDDTLMLFHQVVNISTEIALETSSSSSSSSTFSHSSHSYSSTPLNPTTTPSLQPSSEPSLLQYPINKDVAISLNNLGSVYLDVNDFNQAEYYIRQSLLIREELLNQIMKTNLDREDFLQTEIDLAMCKGNLGRVLLKREQWNEGEIELKEGLELLENQLKNAKNEEEKTKVMPFLERLQFQIIQGGEARAAKENTGEGDGEVEGGEGEEEEKGE